MRNLILTTILLLLFGATAVANEDAALQLIVRAQPSPVSIHDCPELDPTAVWVVCISGYFSPHAYLAGVDELGWMHRLTHWAVVDENTYVSELDYPDGTVLAVVHGPFMTIWAYYLN